MQKQLICVFLTVLVLLITGCQTKTTIKTVTFDDASEIDEDAETEEVHSYQEAAVCSMPSFRFADRDEGAALLTAHTEFQDLMTEYDLIRRVQDEDATMEEYIVLASAQIQSFTDEEKALIEEWWQEIDSFVRCEGYLLPAVNEIVFVKTTGIEEGTGASYTLGNEIYLSDVNKWLLCHELFHCFTRADPSFKREMYELIGFVLEDEPIDIPEDIRQQTIHNPDVGEPCSYAMFTINGKLTKCTMILKATDKGGYETTLLSLEGDNALYALSEATDFYEFVGRNALYNTDPEEILAENFAYAICCDMDDLPENIKTPELIETMKNLLSREVH